VAAIFGSSNSMPNDQAQPALFAALARWDVTALVVNPVIGGGIHGTCRRTGPIAHRNVFPPKLFVED
jgi:hypothetical protein